MWRCLALTMCANLKLARSALYSALLLEALNLNHSAYSILRHSRLEELRIKVASHPLSFEDFSTYKSYAIVGYGAASDFPFVRLGH